MTVITSPHSGREALRGSPAGGRPGEGKRGAIGPIRPALKLCVGFESGTSGPAHSLWQRCAVCAMQSRAVLSLLQRGEVEKGSTPTVSLDRFKGRVRG